MTHLPDLSWIDQRFPDSERGVESICAVMACRDDIAALMGWPKVTSAKRQVAMGRGIVDLLLEHEDRSVTLIEVKRAGLSLRDYCTGIGQLAYQAVMAMSAYQTVNVRSVLSLPGPIPVDVLLACLSARVDILPLCSPQEWRDGCREVAARQ